MSNDNEITLIRLRGWPALVVLILLAALLFWQTRQRFNDESMAEARALVVKRIPLELAREHMPEMQAALDSQQNLDATAKKLLDAYKVEPADIHVDAFTAHGSANEEVTVFKIVFRVKEAPPRTMYFQMEYRNLRGWLEFSLQQTTRAHYWMNMW